MTTNPLGDFLPKNQGLSPMPNVFTTARQQRECAPIRFPSSRRKWELMGRARTKNQEQKKTKGKKDVLRARFPG